MPMEMTAQRKTRPMTIQGAFDFREERIRFIGGRLPGILAGASDLA